MEVIEDSLEAANVAMDSGIQLDSLCPWIVVVPSEAKSIFDYCSLVELLFFNKCKTRQNPCSK